MKKIVWTYGLIAGVIVGAMLFVTIPMFNNGTLAMEYGHLVGYATMIIALSMIFFGVKNYRDNHLGGVISFGKAFKVGILVVAVAALVYALCWEVCYHTVAKGFTDVMTDNYMKKIQASGADQATIDKEMEGVKQMMEMYKNPIVRFGMTILEILPVGLILSVVSAAILKRKSPSGNRMNS